MSNDKVKKILKLCNDNAGAVTIGATFLGLSIAIIRAILLSKGNGEIAYYIISRVGVAELWMSSMVVAVTYIVGCAPLIFIMIHGKERLKALPDLWLTAIMVVLAITPILTMMVCILLALIIKTLQWLSTKQKHKETDTTNIDMKQALLGTFISFVFSIVSTSALSPLYIIKNHDNTVEVGYVISERGDYLTVLNKSRTKIKEVHNRNIDSKNICIEYFGKSGWLLRSIMDIVVNQDDGMADKCPVMKE